MLHNARQLAVAGPSQTHKQRTDMEDAQDKSTKRNGADGKRAVLRRALISRYSGDESKDFWNAVNELPRRSRGELYSLGVVLQNLEGFVLRRLADEGL